MKLFRWDGVAKEQLSPLFVRQAIHGENMTLARMHLLAGAVGEQHQHHHEQMSLLLSGKLRYFIGSEESVMQAGDMVLVPPNAVHGAQALEESVLLDIFSPARGDWSH